MKKKTEKITKPKKKNKKKSFIFPLIIIILLSLSSIGIGIYLEDLYKPQNIAANTFKEVAQTLTSYLYSNENNFLEKDVFTLEKNIKITANSEYINGLAITDPVYKEKSNFLRNLSNSNIHILMQQNKNTKKAYLEYKVSTPNSNLLNAKYLVENATLYYNIENYTKNYINDGTNNYFETLSSENTLKTNNIYLLDFITNSLKTNLKEEYFQQDTEKITIAGKEKNTNKLILILDNNLIIKLQKAILKDLKKDEKSNQILTSYIKDFANLKIDEDKKYLKKGELFSISLYTNRITTKLEKLEIKKSTDETQKKLSLEVVNENLINIYIVENDSLKYIIKSNKIDEANTTVKIYNKENKEIGTISYTKTNKLKTVEAMITDEEKRINFDYNKKMTKEDASTNISLNISEGVTKKLDLHVTSEETLKKNADINIETNDSILKSTLTEEELTKIANVKLDFMTKMKS